jgi:ABC-type dipeptide/oligopeptide/nickel transport system permease subunit
VQRLADILFSFPGFLLALSLVSILGLGVQALTPAWGTMLGEESFVYLPCPYADPIPGPGHLPGRPGL